MTKEDHNRADARSNTAAHEAHESKNGKAERDAALKAVTDNMAKLKALRLAREAAQPPRPAAASKKARSKPKSSGTKSSGTKSSGGKASGEKGPALSDWLAGQQSGGRRI
jgi:hypothetical protein